MRRSHFLSAFRQIRSGFTRQVQIQRSPLSSDRTPLRRAGSDQASPNWGSPNKFAGGQLGSLSGRKPDIFSFLTSRLLLTCTVSLSNMEVQPPGIVIYCSLFDVPGMTRTLTGAIYETRGFVFSPFQPSPALLSIQVTGYYDERRGEPETGQRRPSMVRSRDPGLTAGPTS